MSARDQPKAAEPISVALFGASGRMGRLAAQTLEEHPNTRLVAVFGRQWSAAVPGQRRNFEDLSLLAEQGADVALDLSVGEAVSRHGRAAAEAGVHLVVGASGVGGELLAELASLFGGEGGPNCIVAPNFALGAVLATRMAELAAAFAETIDIVEMHHEAKADAPSGTAIDTAARIAAERERKGVSPPYSKPDVVDRLEGSRGAVGPGGVRLHALRTKGAVAHQEVIFGMEGQTLSVRHDSYDRRSFMPGVIAAVEAVARTSGLTVGLDRVLGL